MEIPNCMGNFLILHIPGCLISAENVIIPGVPKQYSKVTLTQDRQFKTEFLSRGREIPLYNIRLRLLAKQELGLLREKRQSTIPCLLKMPGDD